MKEVASLAPDTGADPILDELVDAFARKLQTGAPVSLEEFADQHPERAAQLLLILPAMQVLADMGSTSASSQSVTNSQEDELAPAKGTLGDFRILREVGRGGMGVVYEAEQISLARRVALKVLPFAATLDNKQIQRFKNEAQAAGQLHHTNIVAVHFVGCERGVHFYAMQYIEGQSLAQVIADLRLQIADFPKKRHAAPVADLKSEILNLKSEIPETPPNARLSTQLSTQSPHYFRTIAGLGIQAALALEHAHDYGVIHRDVKPANLLLDYRGNVWVTDFGLAQIQGDNKLTLTGDLVGTLRYMSPEQALAKRVVVDHRTDIYSLGATLYEMLTLEPVFPGADRQELLRQIAFEDPKPLRRHNKSIPTELETIVMKALEKNPADRYATAKELAEDLERFVKDEPIRARRPSLIRRLKGWCRRHKALVTGVVAILFTIVLMGAMYLWWQERQRAAVAQAVTRDLDEAGIWQKQEQWAKALQALERAKGRLNESESEMSQLLAEVEGKRREIIFVIHLDEAQLKALTSALGGAPKFAGYYETAPRDSEFHNASTIRKLDYAEADKAYSAAFSEQDLDITVLAPEEIAKRIRKSAQQSTLVSALDLWALFKDRMADGNGESLRFIARLADDDPWRKQLRDSQMSQDSRKLERMADSEGVLAQPPANLLFLSYLLDKAKSRAAAVRLLRRAQDRYPASFWINLELAFQLGPDYSTANLAEATGFFRVALALQPQSSAVRNNLTNCLQKQPEAVYRRAIISDPNNAEALLRLGAFLDGQKRYAEAEEPMTKLTQLKPKDGTAFDKLAWAILNQRDPGRAADAEVAFRQAINLNHKTEKMYFGIGLALRDQGKFSEAVVHFRMALEINPSGSEQRGCLCATLLLQQKLLQAELQCRKAILLNPRDAWIYQDLSGALYSQGKYAEAIETSRKAIALRNSFPHALYNLSVFLRAQGKLPEAEDSLRAATELDPTIADVSGGWMLLIKGEFSEALHSFKRCQSTIEEQWAKTGLDRDVKLSEYMTGGIPPAEPAERLALAKQSQLRCRQMYVAAARLYGEAFAADPNLVGELRADVRYDAACAAAQAGCGQGKDSGDLQPEEYARLRGQALDFLRADLAGWRSEFEMDPYKARNGVMYEINQWQEDSALSGVRGDEALAKLPEAERQEWRKFWEEVEELGKRAAASQPR